MLRFDDLDALPPRHREQVAAALGHAKQPPAPVPLMEVLAPVAVGPRVFEFRIVGHPAPQGSKTAGVNKRTGKAVMFDGKKGTGRDRFHAWRETVTTGARLALYDSGGVVFDGPIGVDLLFRMPRPQSRRKSSPIWHATSPDIDKLERSTLDGLGVKVGGGLIADDARIAELRARAIEVDGWIGAHIRVRELEPTTEAAAWWPATP